MADFKAGILGVKLPDFIFDAQIYYVFIEHVLSALLSKYNDTMSPSLTDCDVLCSDY